MSNEVITPLKLNDTVTVDGKTVGSGFDGFYRVFDRELGELIKLCRGDNFPPVFVDTNDVVTILAPFHPDDQPVLDQIVDDLDNPKHRWANLPLDYESHWPDTYQPLY